MFFIISPWNQTLNKHFISDQYFDSGICKPCHSTCDSCDGPTEKACLSCATPLLLQGTQCVGECDSGYYSDGRMCSPCIHTCSRCSTKTNCTECKSHLQVGIIF